MIRKMNGFDVASLVAFGGGGALTVAAYDRLPARVATHFDLHGAPNGWMDRSTEAFFMLGFGLLLCAALRFPAWMPGAWKARAERSPMAVVTFLAVLLLAAVQAIILWKGLHSEAAVLRPTFVVLGVWMLAYSVVLPRIRRNPVVGVRDVWTMTSDEVWARVNRFGSYSFAAASAVVIACGIAGGFVATTLGFVATLAGAAVPHFYSFLVARKLPPES